MAYNTGNPIGSGDPRDLRDNSENLDEAINGTASTWVDRLGVTRKTFKAAENAAQQVEDSAASNIAAIEQDAADVESARDTAITSISSLDAEAQQALDTAEVSWETRFIAGQDDREDRFEADQDSRESQFVQLMVSGGYTGTGVDGAIEEYAAGITVSAYKEIIRENGEFWRAAADTALPYTTTGAGMPEGGAFVNVGDGVLRQDLVQPVATFNSVADMKNSANLDVGRKARTLGYYEPGDGGGNDYEIVAASTGTDDGGSFIDLSGSGLQAKGVFERAPSVKQFGAVGDGITGCSDVFEKMLLSQPAIYVPSGDYLIESPLAVLIPFDVHVKMAPDAVLVGGGYADPMLDIRSADPASSPFKSFSLSGGNMDSSNQTFVGAAQSGTSLSMVRLNQVLIEDVRFYALNTYQESLLAEVGDSAITTVDVRAATFDRLVIIGQPDLGIYMSGGPDDTSTSGDGGQYTVTNCHFIACDAAISAKRRVSGIVISNNTFYKCRNGILLLEVTGVGPGDNTIISNNVFKFTAQRCVEVRAGTGSIVDGNIFEDSGYNLDNVTAADSAYTLRLLGASNSIVSNNLFVMKELSTYSGQHAINVNNYTPTGFTDNVKSERNLCSTNSIVNYNSGIIVAGGGSKENTFLHNQFILVDTEFTGDLKQNTLIGTDNGFIGFQKNSDSLNIDGFSFSREGQMRAVSDSTQAMVLNRRGSYGELMSFYGNTNKQGYLSVNDGFCEFSAGAFRLFDTVVAANAPTLSLFLDEADNLLKFKDSNGTVQVVNLT